MARKNLKWVLAKRIEEKRAHPKAVKRWYDMDGTKHENPEIPDSTLLLRTCAQGEYEGNLTDDYLYCTNDGKFLIRGKDGLWYGQKPNCHTAKNPKAGGGWDCPIMRNFGGLLCHMLIAHAWHGECPTEPNGTPYQIDHINTDHKNFGADNLRYVTPHENMRSARNMHRLQKMGIDPRWLHRNTLLYIYELNLRGLEYFTTEYKILCDVNPDAELSIENIEKIVMMAYMNTRRYFFLMKLPSLDVRYQYPILMPLDHRVTEMKKYYTLIEEL